MVVHSISSNIDEVLSISQSANVFVFGEFNLHHKDWVTYSRSTVGLLTVYLIEVLRLLTSLGLLEL